ncbi:SSI family serine proteinase inhibitor [Streptomyces sp. ok210]|uniref:SSI family serine proteinase inhibitor n=1 Tax=Streptomyces sp. ok210 TaxID=1761905 RepID=UPI0008E96D68|nr:SSI family serine proteinase inhibitor [Streptomyces sp. ok210]SFT29252.1 Subtilisin inhibitor-like [Streptomyces sp. ok210]
MLRRLALTAVASLAVLSAAAPAATAATGPLPLLPLPLPLPSALQGDDGTERTQLRVMVSDSGDREADGVYELRCLPAGGTHPVAQQACDRLAELAQPTDENGGTDPFRPVPADAMCTQQFGGSATARVTGTWQGQHVDASFNRTNGCEIARWNTLRPVLPNIR